MAIVDINWQPTARQLRQFGGICLVALPLVGWFWGAGTTLIAVLAAIGAAVLALSWIAPPTVKPIFLALSVIAIPIGMVIGEIALVLIYFGVFLPMGLAFRLFVGDPLDRALYRSAVSYWQKKKPADGPASYFRQW